MDCGKNQFDIDISQCYRSTMKVAYFEIVQLPVQIPWVCTFDTIVSGMTYNSIIVCYSKRRKQYDDIRSIRAVYAMVIFGQCCSKSEHNRPSLFQHIIAYIASYQPTILLQSSHNLGHRKRDNYSYRTRSSLILTRN